MLCQAVSVPNNQLCFPQRCRPIASLDHFTAENLVNAELVEEHQAGSTKFVKVTGIANQGKTVSIIMRGSNNLVLEEANRSLHDALCVVRCLVKKRYLIAGGGAPGKMTTRKGYILGHAFQVVGRDKTVLPCSTETELNIHLTEYANTLVGVDSYCFKAFAEALEIIPYTLAENAGLNPIATVTELRNRHSQGK